MVDEVRKITGEKRVGHAGTLDPFASGVLIILIGKEATKRQKEFMKMDKTYVAVIKLGATSTTDDVSGEIRNSNIEIPKRDVVSSGPYVRNKISGSEIKKVLGEFIGEIEQVPPLYSAVKLCGRKAYELARKGERPKLKARKVTIYEIKLLKYKWPTLEIKVKCSSGTYIRALTRDIGQKLGCGAYLEGLTRTAIGNFTVRNSLKPGGLQKHLDFFKKKC